MMPKTKAKAKAKPRKKSKSRIEMAMVSPPSQLKRNRPKPPTVLTVCNNVIPVIDGKAAEADPKKLRVRQREKLRKRGLKPDETRI